MLVIFNTLMRSYAEKDIDTKINRALTILTSFKKDAQSPQVSPPFPIQFNFTLSNKPVEFKLSVSNLSGSILTLNMLSSALARIQLLDDIQHAILFELLF